MSLLLHIIVIYSKENIITKLKKLYSLPSTSRVDNKSPALFVKNARARAIYCPCAKYSLKGLRHLIKTYKKNTKLFVTNEEWRDISEKELKYYLEEYGKVKSIETRRNRYLERNEALVCYSAVEEAKSALVDKKMQQSRMDNKAVTAEVQAKMSRIE